MKNSLIIILFFIAGISAGVFKIIPGDSTLSHASEYALYVLMFLVGIGIGGDPKTWQTLRNLNLKIFLIPVCVIVGSLIGGIVSSLFFNHFSMHEGLMVSAGFGYYSLSSILITKYYSEAIGVIALLANMSREILTLLFAPLLARYFGKLAPIASGGATAMDTTLPIITSVVGKQYAIMSVISGVVLTILVPFLVTALLKAV